MKQVKNNSPLIVALMITLLVTFWQQYPRLIDPYQIEEDFRMYHWMHRYQDPDLFLEDRIAFDRIIEYEWGDIHFIVDTASPGFTFLYQVTSNFLSHITFSKILIFPLTLLAVFYLYGIGKAISNSSTAFALAIAFLIVNAAGPTSISTVGGLQRSFVFPFLLGVLFHLHHRDDWLVALYLILGAMIYPSVFILGMVTYGITLLRRQPGSFRLTVAWKRVGPLVVAVIVGLSTLIPYIAQRFSTPTEVTGSTPSFGEQVQMSGLWTGWQLLQTPLYQPGGRSQIVGAFPLAGRGGLATPGMGLIFIIFLAILAIGIVLLDRGVLSRQPKTLNAFFAAIWLCYGLSWFVFLVTGNFYFYLPSRYTEAGLILALLIFVVANARNAMRQFVNLLITRKKLVSWGLILAAVATIVLAFRLPAAPPSTPGITPGDFRWALFLLGGVLFVFAGIYLRKETTDTQSISSQPHNRRLPEVGVRLLSLVLAIGLITFFQPSFYKATSAERELFSYIQTLPKDTLLSGAPYVLDSIPTFTQRQVFMNCENPYFNPTEVMDSLQAYYAPIGGEQVLGEFCENYEIDYLVIDSSNFSPDSKAGSYCSFAPYDQVLYEEVQATQEFALNTVPEELRLFQTESLYIVSCDSQIFPE